jgi:hypothetical protein
MHHDLTKDSVRSKLKCPVLVASEMSGFVNLQQQPELWESRALCGISKRGGKVCFWTFPRRVFSTARDATFWVEGMASPWAL